MILLWQSDGKRTPAVHRVEQHVRPCQLTYLILLDLPFSLVAKEAPAVGNCKVKLRNRRSPKMQRQREGVHDRLTQRTHEPPLHST